MEKIDLRVAATYRVALNSLGSAGYRWSAAVDNPRIVNVERLATHRGLEQFALTGLAPGETIVHFTQARSFEPGKPPHSSRDIFVHVVS